MTSIAIDRVDGLSAAAAIKGPCRAATTANISLYGQQTIDAVAVVTGDRVLVKNQTTGSENGIYVADTGQWRRAKDFSRTNDVLKGTQIAVTDGAVSGGFVYSLLTSNPISVGVTSLSFGFAAGAQIAVNAATAAAASAAAAAASAASIIPLVYATKTGNYTALGSDNNALHRYTATATVSLTAAATLGSSWHYTIMADGGDVTIDPNGAETINGAATLRVPDGSQAEVVCSGTAFFAFVTSTAVYGHCRLTLSGGNLLLSRFNGRRLTINGVAELIPSAGVTLAPSGETPATLYYVYAYMNSGTMTLERSTTVSAVDTATGLRIKTADATRTLVGMIYPETGPVFTDTAKKRFVRSWFNDQGVSLFNNFTASRTTTSTSATELNTEIRCEAILWSGEVFQATAAGSASNSASLGRNASTLGYDTTSTPEVSGSLAIMTNANDNSSFCAQGLKTGLAEGYHFVTLLGFVNSGTGTWSGDSDGRRTSIMCKISR